MRDLMLEMSSVSYAAPGGRTLVKDLNAALAASEALVVQGPNGVGKSTLLRVLLGRTPLIAGNITFSVAPSRVAYLPQLSNGEFHLPMTLEDVIRVSLTGAYRRKDVLDLGLLEEKQLSLAWNTASGGERQKTLLTRTMLQNANVLVLDEPTNHLDAGSRTRVNELLEDFLRVPAPRAAVMVSHDRSNNLQSTGRFRSLDLSTFAC